MISRHHNIEIIIIIKRLINEIKLDLKFKIIIFEIIKLKVFSEIKIGHGLKFKIK